MKQKREGLRVSSLVFSMLVLALVTPRVCSAAMEDKPPTVSITVIPKMLRLGETFKVLLKAEDDVGLQSMWWWGENTGIPELDKAHMARASGTRASFAWTVTATKEDTYTLAANARDSAYPTPGEPHQASEETGIARATISVISEIPMQPVTTVDFMPGVPSSVKYSAALGQVISVQGKKFAPNATYFFNWAAFKCQGEVTTDSRGDFQGQITLPSVVPQGYPREQWFVCYDKQDRRTTTIASRKLTIE